MKLGNIVNTNQKGQLVIPASLRAELGITEHVPLQLLIKGNALYLVPIVALITSNEHDSSYLDMLQKTKGSWRKDKGTHLQQEKLELEASAKRKQAW